MRTLNDRGYAFIARDEHGIKTIKIATGVEHGQPVGVFAEHVRPPDVHADRSVRFIRTPEHHYTAQVVAVTKGGTGHVVIRPLAPRPRSTR